MQKIIKLWVLVFFSLCLFAEVIASDSFSEGNPKVAMVTGANRGIGFALTEKLLEEGLEVYAVVRNPQTLQELQTTYPLLRIIEADLSTLEGRKRVAASAPAQIDYLIHNAAVINPLGPNALLDPLNADLLETLIEVNITTPMSINARLGEKITGARVLMISSIAGDRMVPGLGAYCASKTWMDRYTESLQMDKPRGIFAAAVHPGDVDTGMQGDLRNPTADVFPEVRRFHAWKNENRLLAPETSADYLGWLLLATKNDYFTSKKHSIYDGSHHEHWLGDRVLPFTK